MYKDRNSIRGGYRGAKPSGNFRPRFNSQPNRNRFQNREQIQAAKYVNKAIEQTVENTYVSQHKFTDFNLHPGVVRNLTERGYVTPTPIQDQAIPHVMAGRDVVGI